MTKIYENHSLKALHTFHMDVKSNWFAEYDNENDLCELLRSALLQNTASLPIGSGSNLLFTKDYPGVLLHSAIRFIEKVKEDSDFVYLRTGSGVVWDDFCQYAVEQGYGGVENLSLIPGEVGASAVQNIGAYGVEVADVIDRVEAIDRQTGEKRIFRNEECKYGYRTSIFKTDFKGKYLVTAVIYRLTKKPVLKLDYGNLVEELKDTREITLASVRDAIIRVRNRKLPDPEIAGNAGSFFMNPVIPVALYENLLTTYPLMPHYKVDDAHVKVPAAWLIEQCGWKGKSIGDAAVHDRQCLVLVNKGNASAQEIIELAQAIVSSVKERFSIEIHPEVNYI